MADFYTSYLAFHRGSSIGTAAKPSGASRRPAQLDARRHFMLALASSRAALLPAHLVAVGGVIATGKTTVAVRISREMSAPLLSADRLRRYLAGVAEHPSTREASFGALYSADLAERTYSELIRRADIVLRSGRSVVLDASFRPRWSRTLARDLADACHVAFRFVECTVDYNLCLDRLARRPRQQAEIDGRAGIYQDFIERWEPIVELSPAQHLRIDTSIPLCRNMATLRAQIAVWPRAFPAQR